MPLYTPAELIEKFYNNVVVDKYPHITKQHCQELCRSPFKFLKKCIINSTFAIIRFKYLGTFKPNIKQIVSYSRKVHEAFEKGKITQERLDYFNSKVSPYLKYIDENPPKKGKKDHNKQYDSLSSREL